MAGDVGPLGVRLAPYGRVQIEDAKAAFTEQIAALCEAGVDLLVIETFGDLYEIREAVIRVKTAAGETEDRTIRIRESLHGPIILEQDGRVVAGAICGAHDTTRLEQWLEMNRAQSAEELRNALRMDQASLLNLTYATRDGHFGYIQAGMCPRRPAAGTQALDERAPAPRPDRVGLCGQLVSQRLRRVGQAHCDCLEWLTVLLEGVAC